MRVVLDTDVLVAAVRSASGASHALVKACLTGRYKLLVTSTLVLEYEAVLMRPAHLVASGGQADDIIWLVDTLCRVAEHVPIYFRWRPQLDDPADEHVLEAAVNGRADVIVSFNQRHLGPAGDRFALRVLRPGDLVRKGV